MKEMMKNKWMIGFMVVMISLTYINSTNERRMNEEIQKRVESEIIFTEN